MSYLVLARKWRPRRFAELVGQEHVVQALGNALDSGRVHHAFLFTGTRGVGKTTIARIFAKSLNCERGVSAEPCGECSACREIDAGRFVDLLEIDAASRTKVDDTRDLLDNVVYAPTRGRYKVYLIDEVHMLSTHSFNALLKTLEEPPEHVKFLLATTDPQKLPVTVLSRCLQFNLKRLTEEQIGGQVDSILAAEGIEREAGAIEPIARAADGSLRDALSLLDQAIAFGNGALREHEVRAMLGTVDRSQVTGLLAALAAGDGTALFAAVEEFSAFALDFGAALDELAALLHRVQLLQLVPGSGSAADEGLAAHAAALAPEQVQLWYQMAITGRRDLPLAPTPRIGFEMALLRMLAFRPDGASRAQPGAAAGQGSRSAAGSAETVRGAPRVARAALPAPIGTASSGTASSGTAPSGTAPSGIGAASPSAGERDRSNPEPGPPHRHDTGPRGSLGRDADWTDAHRSDARGREHADRAGADRVGADRVAQERTAPDSREPVRSTAPGHVNGSSLNGASSVVATNLGDNAGWLRLLGDLDLRGPVREVAANAAFVGWNGTTLRLALPEPLQHLCGDMLVGQLAGSLSDALGTTPRIQFVEPGQAAAAPTLSALERSERARRQQDAEDAFLGDPSVQRLMGQHGARPVPDSIRPLDEV